MSRRREKARRKNARSAEPTRASVHAPEGPRVAVASLAAAILLGAACAVPFVLWGNPYPEGVVPYWAWGTLAVAGIAALAAWLLGAWFVDLPGRARALLDRPRPLVFAVLVGTLATALSVAFAIYLFRRSATTSDEIAQLWHARMLLRGRLFLPPDPNPEFFALENVIDVDRGYSQFPIGGPAFLAIGAAIGAPWLVNPILLGLAAAMLYHFGRRVFGETQGRAIAVLFCLAPMVLTMAGTWMNHVPVLFLMTATLAALAEWDRASTRGRRLLFAVLMGLALGAMATVRPVDAIIASLGVGVFQLWVIRAEPRRIGEILLQGVAGALAVMPLLIANAITTGHPLRFAYDVMWGPGHRIGFHEDPYGEVHTVGRALEYAMTYVSELNMYLTAWPTPVLLVAIVALLAMRRVTRWDALLLGLFAIQVAAYASYSLVGEFLGPRFLYTVVPTIVVLVARAPFLLGDRLGDRWRRGAFAFTIACLLVTWGIASLPHGAWGVVNQARMARRPMRVDLAGAVRAANVQRGLVFLREPFGSRLQRRLWGAGVSRGDAARLLQSYDACSLLAAVEAVEADSSLPRAAKPTAILQIATPLAVSERSVLLADRTTRLSTPDSIPPACRAELEADARYATAPFGPALPLEPIDSAGRINGDVVYVADLGDHNAILRERFKDRTWYRLGIRSNADGSLRAEVVPY